MPFAESFSISGLTTAAQTATLPASININCGFLPNRVEIINATSYGSNAALQLIQQLRWNSKYPTTTFGIRESGTINTTTLYSFTATTNAISLYDGTQSLSLGPVLAGSSITNGSPTAIATSSANGLQVGDVVQITAKTANSIVNFQPIAGLYFTVTSLNSTTSFNIGFNSTGFTNEGSTFNVRKVVVGPIFYPTDAVIIAATAANPMVITTATAHGYTVGQKVRVRVPKAYGMVQANNLVGVITAVTTYTMTLNIDSSAFTAFAYPSGGANFVAVSPALICPIGSGPSAVSTPPYWYEDTLLDATTNQQFQGFTIGSGLLLQTTASVIGISPGDQLLWTAFREDM